MTLTKPIQTHNRRQWGQNDSGLGVVPVGGVQQAQMKKAKITFEDALPVVLDAMRNEVGFLSRSEVSLRVEPFGSGHRTTWFVRASGEQYCGDTLAEALSRIESHPQRIARLRAEKIRNLKWQHNQLSKEIESLEVEASK